MLIMISVFMHAKMQSVLHSISPQIDYINESL